MTTNVTTSYGQLQGIDQDRCVAFKGIPFAAPPVGERRFAPPIPPHKWDGVRDTTQYRATSLQVPNEGLNTLLPDLIPDEPQDEDCLYLNVWTPAADNAKRPVLFWIHGGAFTMGSGSPPLYDGSHLVQRGDVVVVTINYRLGALGFLCLPEGVAGDVRTNFGILDQIQALRWVRDEIVNFGGDPDNITIFGESAGAMSVGSVLVSPLPVDYFSVLFRRVELGITRCQWKRRAKQPGYLLKSLAWTCTTSKLYVLSLWPRYWKPRPSSRWSCSIV